MLKATLQASITALLCSAVGVVVGLAVGLSVGLAVGVGEIVGVGEAVGEAVGVGDGEAEGANLNFNPGGNQSKLHQGPFALTGRAKKSENNTIPTRQNFFVPAGILLIILWLIAPSERPAVYVLREYSVGADIKHFVLKTLDQYFFLTKNSSLPHILSRPDSLQESGISQAAHHYTEQREIAKSNSCWLQTPEP